MNKDIMLHNSLQVVFIGENIFLKKGIEEMLGKEVYTDISDDMVGSGRGVLLLAPGGTSTQCRIKMLTLINLIKDSPDWCGINLVDKRDKNLMRFSRLTGVETVDLHIDIDELLGAILFYIQKGNEQRSDSIIGLTPKQWEVISVSLNESQFKEREKTSTFYNHRMTALRRLRLVNIHELRLLVSDCKTSERLY
ncbi:hypothetical protein DPU24_26125 [Salmonella enterica subsp. enterica serovar Oranienburg]|nr:hypothetical protein [Salmonella enterica subsp. enterica serovar Newport]EBW6364200.1 hypothetical protein [Salmonella enterica subsp. enterica serovar Oranienburg]EDU7787247.1 hypothetical protein [Salmonella enterica subsp. enterica serovar Oranienburg]HAK8205023.1 hypothetical protein [Salmonella enterica]